MFNIIMSSLGCDKNTVDSEKMLAELESRGYGLTSDPEEADGAIVNTCCFIESATEESIDKIMELAQLKEGRLKHLVVAGCMAERFKNEIVADMPEVDAFIGTSALDQIADVFDRLQQGDEKVTVFESIDKKLPDKGFTKRVITEHPYLGYLKIADGCDKRCTYCAIPYFKGKFRSVPMESLIEEAKGLAENGVRELVLVAQEVTCYGQDLYGEKSLHKLIQELSKVDGIEWIRLLYCYPEEIYDEMIQEMATNPKVVHYIDMPIQHTEDSILKRMARRIDHKGIINVVNKLRIAMPDIAIRTTLITGFPGETEEDHNKLISTLKLLRLDHVGAFPYSREEGTPAYDFEPQIDREVAEDYLADIMEVQQEITFDINQGLIGKELEVIIEGYLPDDDIYVARTFRDAPEVDSITFVSADHELMSGSIVPVKITDADGYDLVGELL